MENYECGFISKKNVGLQINFLNGRYRKNMNSILNQKSKNLEKLGILPPPAKEVKYHRFYENRICVNSIDFNFFSDINKI